MRIRVATTAILAAMALALVSAQTDVSGRWNMTFNTDQGSTSATLVLAQDGESLSGSLISDQGTVEFDGGTVSGNKLTWSIEIDADGAFFEIAMEGMLDGDKLAGSADFGGYAGGDWTATRAAQ